MAGLAIGSYVVGRRVDRVAQPLRLYGLLELGIAASALVFAGLMKLYPSIYVALAQGRDDATLYLTVVRMLFSVVALIVPTMLMGGDAAGPLALRLAAAGATCAATCPSCTASTPWARCSGRCSRASCFSGCTPSARRSTLAVATNALIGLVSLVLQASVGGPPSRGREPRAAAPGSGSDTRALPSRRTERRTGSRSRLVLWGIGLSGFCALGYEVLWTRVLTLAVGASVYGFTIILVAFLTGIALGSEACGLLVAVVWTRAPRHQTGRRLVRDRRRS